MGDAGEHRLSVGAIGAQAAGARAVAASGSLRGLRPPQARQADATIARAWARMADLANIERCRAASRPETLAAAGGVKSKPQSRALRT